MSDARVADFSAQRVILGRERALKLDSGYELRDFPLAYQTYGALDAGGPTRSWSAMR